MQGYRCEQPIPDHWIVNQSVDNQIRIRGSDITHRVHHRGPQLPECKYFFVLFWMWFLGDIWYDLLTESMCCLCWSWRVQHPPQWAQCLDTMSQPVPDSCNVPAHPGRWLSGTWPGHSSYPASLPSGICVAFLKFFFFLFIKKKKLKIIYINWCLGKGSHVRKERKWLEDTVDQPGLMLGSSNIHETVTKALGIYN